MQKNTYDQGCFLLEPWHASVDAILPFLSPDLCLEILSPVRRLGIGTWFYTRATSVRCTEAQHFDSEPLGAPTSEILVCEVQDVVVAELLPDADQGLLHRVFRAEQPHYDVPDETVFRLDLS